LDQLDAGIQAPDDILGGAPNFRQQDFIDNAEWQFPDVPVSQFEHNQLRGLPNLQHIVFGARQRVHDESGPLFI
jgi:hypothetical protein